MAGFVGFSSFAKLPPNRNPTSSKHSPPPSGFIYSGEDSEIAATLKKITKKDETTKLRGLSEFTQLIQTKDKSFLRNAIPAFLSGTGLFVDLCVHNDRRIRTACMYTVREYVMIGLRKAFSNQLVESTNRSVNSDSYEGEDESGGPQQIIAITPSLAILLVLCDPVNEVAKAAESAFSEIFSPPPSSSISSPGSPVSPLSMIQSSPELLKLEAMSLFAPEVIPRLIKLLSLSSAQVSDMRTVSVEEAEERIERIHSSALDLFSTFVSLSDPTSTLDSESDAEKRRMLSGSIKNIINRSQLATDAYCVLARHFECKSPSIRRSSYRLVSALCRFTPLVLIREKSLTSTLSIPSRGERDSFLVPMRIPTAELCSLVLSCCIAEKASQAQSIAFETARLFLQAFPLIFGCFRLDNWESEDFIASIAASLFTSANENVLSSSTINKLDTLAPVVDLRKVFWSKLVDQLKRSCYGSGEAVYPHILSILVLFPPRMLLVPFVIQSSKTVKGSASQQSMISRVLLHVLGGLRNQASEESLTHQGQLCAVQSFCDISVLSLAVATRILPDSEVFEVSLYVEQQVFGLMLFLLSSLLLENSAPESERIDFLRKLVSNAIADNALDSAYAAIQELGFSESTAATNSSSPASLGRGVRDCISSGLVKVLKQLEDIARRRVLSGKSTSRISSVLTSLWRSIESSLAQSLRNAPTLCKRVIASLLAEEIQSEDYNLCLRKVHEALFRTIDGELKTLVTNPQKATELLSTLVLFSGKDYLCSHFSPRLWLEETSSSAVATSSMEVVSLISQLAVNELQEKKNSDEDVFLECIRSVIGDSAVEAMSKGASIEEIVALLKPRMYPLESFFKSTSAMMTAGKFSLPETFDSTRVGKICKSIFRALSFEVMSSLEGTSIAMRVLLEMKNLGCLTKKDESEINKNAADSTNSAYVEISSTNVISPRNESCLEKVIGWYTLRSQLCSKTDSVKEMIQLWRVESILLFSHTSSISQTSRTLISAITDILCREVDALKSSAPLMSETMIAVEGVIRDEFYQLEIPNNALARNSSKSAAAFLSNISFFPCIKWEELSSRLNLWSFSGREEHIVFLSWLLVLNKVKIFDVAQNIVPTLGFSQSLVPNLNKDVILYRFPLHLLINSIKVIYGELRRSVSRGNFQISQDAYAILSELNDTAGGDESLVDEALRDALTSTDKLIPPRKDRLLAAKKCLVASMMRVQGVHVSEELVSSVDPWESLAARCLAHRGRWQTNAAEGPFTKVDLLDRTKTYQSSLISLCASALSNCTANESNFFSVDRIASIGRAASRLHALLATDAHLKDINILKDLFPSPHPIICGVVCAETLHNTIVSYMHLQTDLDRRRSFRHVLSLIAVTRACWSRRHVNLYPSSKGEAVACECAALLFIKAIESTVEFLFTHYFKLSFDIRVALSGVLDSCILPMHSMPWLHVYEKGQVHSKEIVKRVMTHSTEKWPLASGNGEAETPEIRGEPLMSNDPLRLPEQSENSLANSFTSAVGTLFRVGASFVGSVFSDTQSIAAADATVHAVTETAQPPLPLQQSGSGTQVRPDESDLGDVEKHISSALYFFPEAVIRQIVIKDDDNGMAIPTIMFSNENEGLYTFDEDDDDEDEDDDEDDNNEDEDDDDEDEYYRKEALHVQNSASRMWLHKSTMLHHGCSLLPQHVSDCLEDQGCIGRIELIFYEICSAVEGEGSIAPSISAYQDADSFFRCAHRALSILERSVDERMFRSLSLYLSSERKTIDDIVLKGAMFTRVLEACMKLFLGLDDLFSNGVGSIIQNPPALEMALNVTEELSFPPSILSDIDAARIRGAKIIILAMSFMIRFAAVAPSKFVEAFSSFPKGIKSEAVRFISRYITTRIFEAHLADAHKFASDSRASEAKSKRQTSSNVQSLVAPSSNVQSLVALGSSENDLSFICQQIVSPESSTFAGAGVSLRPTTSITSFLRGFHDESLHHSPPSSSSFTSKDDVEFTIRGTRSSREIVGVYTVGEATVSATISFPSSYPLKKVTVILDQRMGLTDSQAQRLELQLSKLISNHGSSMASVFSVLKQTVDSILRGIEPCPVCYCVLDTDSRLPKLSCLTCSNKYHKSCLMKWFSKAVEPTCPLCRQPWRGH